MHLACAVNAHIRFSMLRFSSLRNAQNFHHHLRFLGYVKIRKNKNKNSQFSILNSQFLIGMTPQEILQVEKDIVLTLKNVFDPEIPVNIYDLGLIYEIDYDPSGEATIRMTLTAPNCPMADMLVEDVNTQVAKVKGVKKVNVILVFEPAWDRSMMSEEALLDLNMF